MLSSQGIFIGHEEALAEAKFERVLKRHRSVSWGVKSLWSLICPVANPTPYEVYPILAKNDTLSA